MKTDKDFFKQIKQLRPDADVVFLQKALNFAKVAHEGQQRYNGDPYITHSMATALILASWHMSTETIAAGLLHDTVEDGDATVEQLETEFSKGVGILVDGVSKVSSIRLMGSRQELFVENLRKMIVATSKDLRVILVKLADRLHNMRTLRFVPLAKQKRIARETLEIYGPLADRLGMGLLKRELDDLAFPFVYPDEAVWLSRVAGSYYRKAERDVHLAYKELESHLKDYHVQALLSARIKGRYSLYKKLRRPEINKDMTRIHDLLAMRVIVKDVSSCYAVLGIIHSLWRPVPWLSISDFIAQPKPNGYQSLHTKVFRENRIIEIQVRTEYMHEEAEMGIASHVHYSEMKELGATSEQLEKGVVTAAPEKKMAWVKKLVTLMNEIKDNNELLDNLKLDIFATRIFVYTPEGDVVDLPLGATPIDFAFHIHTNLGKYIKAATVNGKIVPLNYHLRSGDICEIIKQNQPRIPPADWLSNCVTRAARSGILKMRRN